MVTFSSAHFNRKMKSDDCRIIDFFLVIQILLDYFGRGNSRVLSVFPW